MDGGRQQSLALVITVSGATGLGTLTNQWEIVRWGRVVPPSESDTYSFKIKDANGYLMLARTNQTGTWSEKIEMSLGIMRTVEITGASADGSYRFIVDFH